jgi:hypothetical protein
MPWYNYLACFFAGAFLANVIPHFVSGTSGDPFPTPFAKPPGKGLSSPTLNVLWSLLNLVLGYVLFRVGHVNAQNTASLLVFFAGIAFLSIQLSIGFQKKHPRWHSAITHPVDSPPPPCHTKDPSP